MIQTTFTASGTAPHPGNMSPGRQALRAAKRQNRELREQRLASRIAGANRLLEGAGGWEQDIYAMLDRFSSWQADFGGQQFAGIGYGGFASTLNDRRYGKDFPIYQTEVDLQVMRFASRLLLATNGYAIGMLEGITSYVIADGFTQEVKERQGHQDEVDPALLDKLNSVLDAFRDQNDWHGGEQPGLEEEIFQRGEEDGEIVLCLYEDADGCCYVNTVEPEQLTASGGPQTMDWLFGVLQSPNNQRPEAYWLRGMQTDEAGESYSPEQIVHYKNNVKRQMKRGIPSFSFGVADTLRLADNLRGQLGRGAGKQAGIAGIRQWDNATATQVQGFKAAFESYGQTTLQGTPAPRGGPTDVAFEDVPKGMTWVAPPNASNAPAHVQILQACLRGATARWNAPEWIGSGDAGNNGFAGALVVDAPFTKRVIRVQRRQEAIQKRIFTWALETRCERQRVITAVRPDGTVVSKPWEELRRLVEVVVTAPSVEVRNKLEEAQANQIRVTGGWKSPQTVQAEENLDSERELANILEWRQETQPAGPMLPMPGDGPGGGTGGDPSGQPLPTATGGDGEPKASPSMTTPKPPAFTESTILRLAPEHITLLESVQRGLLELAGGSKEPGFTGVDSRGHHWQNGKQVSADKGGGAAKPGGEGAPGGTPLATTTSTSGTSGKLAQAEAELAKDAQPAIAAGGTMRDLSIRVAGAVVRLATPAVLSEFPVWATETCDLWIYENAMNGQHPGGVMAAKVAGFAILKAWQGAKAVAGKLRGKAVQESTEGAPDLQTAARQVQTMLAGIAEAAGWDAPDLAEIMGRLKHAKSAGGAT
jgi:hypothetical protein